MQSILPIGITNLMRQGPRACLALLAALVACSAASAQQVGTQVKLRHITVDQGLSQNFVYTILRDSKGYMWFGTRDGLNKFDGYTFTCYRNRPFVANSLPSSVIRCVVEDRRGMIWIATQRAGLVRLDRKTGRWLAWRHVANDPGSFGEDDLETLFIDRDGYLWIGTFSHGVYRACIAPDSIRVDRYGRAAPLSMRHFAAAISEHGRVPMLEAHCI
jgi:ligand-binding sensor domain-containing protein